MSPGRWIAKEIAFRRWNCLLGIGAVTLAVGTVVATLTLLDAHEDQVRTMLQSREAETHERMESLQTVVDKAMTGLGFNIVILPGDQDLGDWHSAGHAAQTMPDRLIHSLRQAEPLTIEKPVAQLRQKVKWPENQWTIILTGTEGRLLGDAGDAGIQHIAAGALWLGHEIHRGLGLHPLSTITLFGREFRVERCLPQEGNKDDITVWMNLADAQALLGKEGLINEIVAVESRKAWANPNQVRRELATILPGVQVIEDMPKAVSALRSRLNAERGAQAAIDLEKTTQIRLRHERTRTAGLINAAVLLVCAGWIGLLAFTNAAERRGEVGILTAMGVPFPRVAFLFWAKWTALAIVGAAAGFLAGVAFGVAMSGGTSRGADVLLQRLADTRGVTLAALTAVGLAMLGSWIPIFVLSRQDPAAILQQGLE